MLRSQSMDTKETSLELSRALHTMSLTNATPQDESATPAKNISPFLRLPVELRYIIYSFATDEPEWFTPDPKEAALLSMNANYDPRRRFARRPHNQRLFQQQRAFLTTDSHEPQLTCAHPLSRANRQLRAESSTFLRTASIPVVSRVRDLNFAHVQRFLSALEEVHQHAFQVGHDGVAARKLTIELQGPYTASCISNLQRWIDFVHVFIGPEKRAELFAFYKTISVDGPKPVAVFLPLMPARGGKLMRTGNEDLCTRVPIPVMLDVLEYYGSIAPGGGEIELDKIARTLHHRHWREFWMLCTTDQEVSRVIKSMIVH